MKKTYRIGDEGDNWLWGQLYADDFIFGLEGDDVIGDPMVYDAYIPSNDRYYGNEGDDILVTRDGNDRLFGNSGDDIFRVISHPGVTRIRGGEGEDTVKLFAFEEEPDVIVKVDRVVVKGEDFRIVLRDVENWDI